MSARKPTPDMAVAVGRFHPAGPDGYRAASMPDAPLRATRAEAVADELAWLDGEPLCATYVGGAWCLDPSERRTLTLACGHAFETRVCDAHESHPRRCGRCTAAPITVPDDLTLFEAS